MLERNIENYLKKKAKENGFIIFKLQFIGINGAPDRMLCKDGKIIFVELKAPGKKPKKHQLLLHNKFKEQKLNIFVIDSTRLVDELIEKFK